MTKPTLMELKFWIPILVARNETLLKAEADLGSKNGYDVPPLLIQTLV